LRRIAPHRDNCLTVLWYFRERVDPLRLRVRIWSAIGLRRPLESVRPLARAA